MRRIKDFIFFMFVRYELLKTQFQRLTNNKKDKKEEDEWYL